MTETKTEVRYECAVNPKGCPTATKDESAETEPSCCGQPMKKADDSCSSKSSCCG